MKMSKQYYLYCFIVFVTSSKGAKIYLLDLRGDRSEISSDNAIHKIKSNNPFYSSDVETHKPHRDAFMKQFITLLGHQNIKYVKDEKKKRKTTCNRHFGSMFGTKLQKLQCIYDLNRDKNQQFAKRTVKRFPNYLGSSSYEVPVHKSPKKYKNKYRFGDFTRGDTPILHFSNDYLDVGDLARSEVSSEGFASNYVDYRDLRRPDIKNFDKIYNKNTNFRKVGTNPNIPKNEGVRAEDSDSERRKYRKLKRFQVIKNSDSNESSSKQVSTESEDASQEVVAKSNELTDKDDSEEVPRKKHKKKDKETSFSDVDDKYVYIQGRNRQYGVNTASGVASDSDSDADARKRLPTFLPKRYHWKEEDIPDLDNFWTNGFKGR